MRIEQRHLHRLDPPIGLHAPKHRDELAEHLDGAFLATTDRRTKPTNKARSVTTTPSRRSTVRTSQNTPHGASRAATYRSLTAPFPP